MKLAFKFSIFVWAVASIISLGAVLYLLPSYTLVGAFAQAFRTPENPDLLHWFYSCAISFVIGVAVTIWLWRTYRRQYGSLWKSN
jgi:hypothetical protein